MTDKKFMSLAEALAPPPEHPLSAPGLEPATPDALLDPKAFAEALLTSHEFRQFILNSLTLGTLSSAVILRLMDYAWGKPVERVEVKDTTIDVAHMSAEQLDAHAARLQEMAQFLRRAEQFDAPLDSNSVH